MSDTWGLEETDTSAVVAKLAAEVKAKNPDAIMVLSNPIHAPGIQKQLRALGVEQQIVGSPAATAPAMFMQGPQDAEGMLAIGTGTVNAPGLPDDFAAKPDMVAFNDRFTAATGQPADFYAGFGYDSLYIVLNAMKAAGGTDKAAVRDAIEATTGWQGMQGIFNYSADRPRGRPRRPGRVAHQERRIRVRPRSDVDPVGLSLEAPPGPAGRGPRAAGVHMDPRRRTHCSCGTAVP